MNSSNISKYIKYLDNINYVKKIIFNISMY